MAAKTIQSFHDLQVWREGVELALDCYKVTDGFPSAERFGLTAQIRKCGVSIASNVAEGHSRQETGSYLRHVRIALGSEAELETQLIIAQRLGLCPEQTLRLVSRRRERIGRMLNALAASLKQRLAREISGRRRGGVRAERLHAS